MRVWEACHDHAHCHESRIHLKIHAQLTIVTLAMPLTTVQDHFELATSQLFLLVPPSSSYLSRHHNHLHRPLRDLPALYHFGPLPMMTLRLVAAFYRWQGPSEALRVGASYKPWAR